MITVENDRNIRDFNTFGLNVKCVRFIEYSDENDLTHLMPDLIISGTMPVLHIGRGSNLLFTKNFDGTILHSAISSIEVDSEDSETCNVKIGAGVLFDDFCAWAASENLWGVENLSHIPGEVGAAAVQNIGAYGSEIRDVITSVRCFDNEGRTFVDIPAEDCEYGYRDSIFKHSTIGRNSRYIVTSVSIRLKKSYAPRLDYRALAERICDNGELTPEMVRNTVIAIREEKLPDPSSVGSAGSFFKNPVVSEGMYAALCEEFGAIPHYNMGDDNVKIPAAYLIEKCGWKGYREGNVAVWERQPLVIVNFTGNASAEEIIDLETEIVNSVMDKFSIELHPEVEHIY